MTSFAGSRWWRFDFHTHTPASADYGKGQDQAQLRTITAEDWLLGFMRAEIDCVAITDHNTGAWIDRLKAAYESMRQSAHPAFRELALFPGVEITANGGVHVLAIFDPSKATADVEALRGAVKYRGAPGESASAADLSVIQVLEEIHGAGALAVLAHVDGPSGAFQMSGNTLDPLLRRAELFAMEVCNRNAALPQLYTEKKLAWAQVLGSDAHHPGGTPGSRYPGSHFTWVKMGTPTLEGLRLALLDGSPLSILRSDATTDNPNERVADHRICGITVTEAQYSGRGSSFQASLSPWLTAIIGGRGTGKSTVIELLRLAMRRERDVPDGLLADLARFRPADGDEGGGALTPHTVVTIEYAKDGGSYRVHWRATGAAPYIERLVSGRWEPTDGVVRERFPVRLLSQKEIYLLADTPSALLHIIDDTPEVNRPEWDQRWTQAVSRYMSLRATARRLRAELDVEPSLRGQLEDLKGKLAIFEKTAHADVLKNYQRRQAQQIQLTALGEALAGFGADLEAVTDQLTLSDVDRAVYDTADSADVDALALIEEAVQIAARLRDDLGSVIERARKSATTWVATSAAGNWASAAALATKSYEDLIASLKAQGVADPSQYGPLVKQRQGVEQRLSAIDETRSELERTDADAATSLQALEDLRGELTTKRVQFLETVLKDNEHVRIEVQPFGADEDALGLEIRRVLGCDEDKYETDIAAVIQVLRAALSPKPGASASDFGTTLRAIKESFAQVVAGKTGLYGAWFEKFLRTLTPDVVDRFRVWFPDDGVRISYSRRGNGRSWEPLHQGSPGQKTAAILAFLLCHGSEPIVLDQPEDDLDNQLITDLVVAQIRVSKTHRQVVVGTHNPNIVVNGDAEQVLVMDMVKGQCVVVASGGLQSTQVREQICQVMEGGREAFEQRYKRIVAVGGHHA
jgi:energy-coupling factor transporter ATP-binding protein EcfA2